MRYAVPIGATLVVAWSVRGHSPSDAKHPFDSNLLRADPAIGAPGLLPGNLQAPGPVEDRRKTLHVCAQYCACNAQLVAKLTKATSGRAQIALVVAGSQATPDLGDHVCGGGATSGVLASIPSQRVLLVTGLSVFRRRQAHLAPEGARGELGRRNSNRTRVLTNWRTAVANIYERNAYLDTDRMLGRCRLYGESGRCAR
jgi:hypothetical protein